MHIVICTIGFAGKSAEQFFSLLQQAGVKHILDIRQNRGGQLSGFAKHPDLAFFLERIAGVTYAHEPLLAPAPELLKAYRKNKNWPGYEQGFLATMKERGVPHSLKMSDWPNSFALLCSEAGPEKCHRRLVADLLAEYWRAQGHSVEICHLVAEKAGRSRPRRELRRKPSDPER